MRYRVKNPRKREFDDLDMVMSIRKENNLLLQNLSHESTIVIRPGERWKVFTRTTQG